jgi:hypothetical protein
VAAKPCPSIPAVQEGAHHAPDLFLLRGATAARLVLYRITPTDPPRSAPSVVDPSSGVESGRKCGRRFATAPPAAVPRPAGRRTGRARSRRSCHEDPLFPGQRHSHHHPGGFAIPHQGFSCSSLQPVRRRQRRRRWE